MTVPFLSVTPRAIKLKVLPRFPAQLIGRAGIDVTKDSGNYYLDLDYTDFPVIGAVPAGATYALIFDPVAGTYARLPISLLGGGGGIADAPSDGFTYGRNNAAWVRALALAGGTLTGPLLLAADPAVPLGAATKQYVDASGGGAGAVRYDIAQSLTAAQRSQARANLDVMKRNYIVNGGMMISQENAATAGTNNWYPADQWLNAGALTAGSYTVAQVASVTPGGSPNRIRVTITGANASPGAGD